MQCLIKSSKYNDELIFLFNTKISFEKSRIVTAHCQTTDSTNRHYGKTILGETEERSESGNHKFFRQKWNVVICFQITYRNIMYFEDNH